jgi:hypothetical protein
MPVKLIVALVKVWTEKNDPSAVFTRGGWVHLTDGRKYTVAEAYSLISNNGVL